MALKLFKKNKDKSDKRKEKKAEEVAEIEELDALEPEFEEQNALRAADEEPEDEDEDLTDEMIEKMLEDELGIAAEDDFEAKTAGDAIEVLKADDAAEVPVVHDVVEISELDDAVDTLDADAMIEDTAAPDDIPKEKKKDGYFNRVRGRLFKSRKSLSDGFDSIFTGKTKIDDDLLEELEELLITSDIGVQTSIKLIERIAKAKVKDVDQLKAVLKEKVLSILTAEPDESRTEITKPHIILVIGVNGVGKTTTIGKLAASAHASGQKVLIAAADTFRAAAVEQLGIWAERANAEFVKHKENADPAAVAFDAVAAASARGCDLVFIDTAGRLHTKVNLMEELKKIKRTVARQLAGAPHETLLVLDATTGQNALSQARMFNEALDISGLVLTKLDGTAKGGIVIGICSELNIPLRYIGIGEQIDDLRPFDAEQFIDALF
ncbi:MAG: signal recognition particle-docking protein FtsY [bacterium]|nr:signal recognition particle-docking protein FtsY [bacterium]